MRYCAVGLLLVIRLGAEPPKRPEVFGHIGYFHMAGDEGNLGNGAGYGGTVVLPFTPRFAVDFGVITASTSFTDRAETSARRRTLVLPSIVWRKGNERAYFFAGGGIGAQLDRYSYRVTEPPGQFSGSTSEVALHVRTGGVFQVKSRLLFRADLVWAHRYVLPSIALNASVGLRF